jgi:RNA polymerase sigma-70 factor (ECF subfamily)
VPNTLAHLVKKGDMQSEWKASCSLSDQELIALAPTNAEAFAALYQRYLPNVHRYLLGFTGSREDAAGLTQQVFARAFEHINRYEDRGLPFTAWLLRIARNAATDAGSRRRPVLAWVHLPARTLPAADMSVEDTALRREELHRLRLLVRRLPTEKQDLLVLRFGGRLTCAEIARVVGKSESAVTKQITRALHQLKKALDQFGTLSGVRPIERWCVNPPGSSTQSCLPPGCDLSHAAYHSRYVSLVYHQLLAGTDAHCAIHPTAYEARLLRHFHVHYGLEPGTKQKCWWVLNGPSELNPLPLLLVGGYVQAKQAISLIAPPRSRIRSGCPPLRS